MIPSEEGTNGAAGRPLRNGLCVGRAHDVPAPDPGTAVVDQDLSLVAATSQAWWIDRLGMRPPNDAEPLPGFIYAAATRAAASAGERPARMRLQTADGRWVVVRVAPLTHAAAPLGRVARSPPGPKPQLSVLPCARHRGHSPAPSDRSVRNCERSRRAAATQLDGSRRTPPR